MSNIPFTDKNPKLFYDASEFQFLTPLVNNFSDIRNELLNLIDINIDNQWLRTFPNYVQSDKHKAWKVFSFIFFNMKFPSHAKLCPKTAELIYSIPEILSCDYSYLEANTKIMAHKGYIFIFVAIKIYSESIKCFTKQNSFPLFYFFKFNFFCFEMLISRRIFRNQPISHQLPGPLTQE